MIFTVINIGTGYLNRPNWLLAGYSVYHRVASQVLRASQPGSQPTMFMTGLRTRHRAGRPPFLLQACELGTSRGDGACRKPTMFMTGPNLGTSSGACMRVARPARAGRSGRFRTGYIRGVQYCNRVCVWKFLARYIVTGCIFCAPSGLWQGQILNPQRHPLTHLSVECPPPPPPPPGQYRTLNSEW